MLKLYSSAQMRAADSYTINTLKVSSEKLMRRAGVAIAEEVAASAAAEDKILVVCGTGNNGGDGYVCARELISRGLNVSVYALDGRYSADCKREKDRFDGTYASTIEGDIIVDCIFGTGLDREVTGIPAEIIESINASGAYIISADIPSGLSGNSGKVLGHSVNADKTVAIGALKTGFALSDGLDRCGEVIVKDIGICLDERTFSQVYEDGDIAAMFPARPRNSHKGTFGTASLACGSGQYIGSAVLAVSAALKSGCGYVKAVCPDNVKAAIAPRYPQTVFTRGYDFSSKAIAIGMGCGVSQELYSAIEGLLKDYEGTLIIDADGLNSLAKYGMDILKNKKCSVILTPHAKEFSRISGKSVEEVLADPVGLANELAAEYDVIIVLKGAGTVISDGVRTAINVRGCSALAKAGSGDMLAGFMCGSIARGLAPFEGAVCAAYVLGAAAELAAGEVTEYCATADDILKNIPIVVKNILLAS